MSEVEAPDRAGGLRAYIAVTIAYWAFMLTDGALRMLVLLHFHTLGFSPIQIAWLFVLYELASMVTNLYAGWLAARFGMTLTLYAGLALQIGALAALTMVEPGWALVTSVIFVMVAQGAAGVAKDLTKMSAKSAVKILAPVGEQGALFRWVAVLTGSKNAVKGLGYLMGASLLGVVGFGPSLWGMAAALAMVLAAVLAFMPPGLPKGRKSAKFAEVFSKDRNVNLLSAARLFLFGARDTWFVVGIPVYFYSVLSDGTAAGDRAAFFQIGTFMAVWIVGYGAVQAATPKVLRARELGVAQTVGLARLWVGLLTLVPVVLAAASFWAEGAPDRLTMTLVGGLLIFGVIFAVNSSLHSYLILAFTTNSRVTMDVGFYYMSNAGGRLAGTVLSGLTYQFGGLPLCLGTAAAMAGLSWAFAGRLDRAQAATA